MAYPRPPLVLATLLASIAIAASCGGSEPAVGENPELRAVLLEMFEADQAERTGEISASNDAARTARLGEIIDGHGWPTQSLVGDDGATAAWLVAQHSDHDVEFQEQALEHMRSAVGNDEADPTELAYLEDRVAVNRGRPQIYGSQVECRSGEFVPRPIADEQDVDERRAEVGLEPLADYLAEFGESC